MLYTKEDGGSDGRDSNAPFGSWKGNVRFVERRLEVGRERGVHVIFGVELTVVELNRVVFFF